MQSHIFQFVNILRGAGIRICTEEMLSALIGIGHIDLGEKSLFKALLQATLIKRSDDLQEFNRLFDLYFTHFTVNDQSLVLPPAQGDLAESVEEILAQANGLFSPWFRQLVIEGLPPLASALLEISQRVGLADILYPLQEKQFLMKMRKEFGMENMMEETGHLLSRLEAQGVGQAERDSLEQEVSERVSLFEDILKDHVGRQSKAYLDKQRSRELSSELMAKGFGALSPWEIQNMRQTIQELVKKMRDEFSLRQKRKRRGVFDLKHTLRKSMGYDGLPIEIVFRKKHRSKGRIVVLCDVSSSVWNASRFMLHLLYSLQDQFDKVRSFVFVDQLGEVTEFFERQEVNEAVETALNEVNIPYNRYTDYGSVFNQFCDEYADIVNRKTTFIVIGDGRTNFFDPGEDALGRIRLRARRTIWLNPERKSFWGSGDSVMNYYRKNCDEVRECRNLQQLIEFVDELTL